MKTVYRVFVMACLLGLATSAYPSAQDWKCLEWTDSASKEAPIDQQLSRDLVAGVWTSTRAVAYGDEEVKLVFQFEADGHMTYLQQNDHGHFVEQNMHWYVKANPEKTLLVLDNNGKQETFVVEKGCEGLGMTQVSTGKFFEMEFRPKEPTADLTEFHRLLIGEWEHISTKLEIAQNAPRSRGKNKGSQMAGLLTYDLRPDGTYTRCLRNARTGEILFKGHGHWGLSTDGSLLVLRPEGEDDAICAQIKLLKNNELVLEQALNLTDEKAGQEIDDFYFQKI